MEPQWKMVSTLMLGLILAAGCASNKPMATATPIQDLKAPDWVKKGKGSLGTDNGKVFYGVGSASAIQNPSLLRSTADTRARIELAKIFQSYNTSLEKGYQASIIAGNPAAASEEQLIERAWKSVTAMTLSGAEIVDHWQNPESGEFYSLARLHLDTFKNSSEKSKELDAKMKEYIRQNSDRMHEQLEKESMKINPGN